MKRSSYLETVKRYFTTHPVVALLGPRQCGKTTLAKQFADTWQKSLPIYHFDLEDPTDLSKLEDPKLALQDLRGLIIIDEVQYKPDLFPLIRVLVDKNRGKQHFLILGSASRHLIQQSSESLAGRVALMEMTPFHYNEVGDMQRLWHRGGFPESYLASTMQESLDWRNFYIKTFLEQDIPNLGFNIPAQALRRFWMMLAHVHGNVLNASDLAQSLGISNMTVRRYVDILVGTFMIRELKPWFENIKKRQVKASKIFFRDTGIYHTLMGIQTEEQLRFHPKLGASWEGCAMEEIIRHHQVDTEDCYFWGTHNKAELDLLIVKNNQRLAFEIKHTSTPKITKSMHSALHDLKLEHLTVIIPGSDHFPLADNISVCGLEHYLTQ